jgi:integrase
MPEKPALNEATVKALSIPKKGNRVYYFAGDVLQGIRAPQGFGVRVTAAGIRSFVLNYRLRGREYRYTIGQYPTWSALRAVREARDLRQRIDRGENPLEARLPPAPSEAPKVVGDVIEEFLKRYVQAPGRPLRSAKEYERALRKQVVPAIGNLGIHDLRRTRIVEMLDTIEDEHGPVQADRTLAYFRKCLNWYATRDDRFVPPIVPGMARTKSKERTRERILSDDEIRLIWPHLSSTFGTFVRVLLLTGQRRSEVATMRRSEIDKDGVWIIPPEKYKTKRAQVVPLSKVVREIIEARSNGHDHVFSTRKETAFSAWGNAKRALDEAIDAARAADAARERRKLDPMAPWTLHDLRRTAKTLMVRVGVRPDISERVLGHAIAGVEGVYDRHSYLDEKRDALEKLAAVVERILNQAPASVVPLAERRQGARS